MKTRRPERTARARRPSNRTAPARKRSPKSQPTVADLCRAMESIAPTGLAQGWDNVGLLTGNPRDDLARVLLCIDLTPAVLDEAVAERIDLILAYHPPIFKPVASIRADAPGTEAVVYACIRRAMAIYAPHTALDAAAGGTNDVIAALCGIKQTEPLAYVDEPGTRECKLSVMVPPDQVDRVADALFGAGAGHIGDYSRCSFRTTGRGTFLGGDTTHPTVGARGRMEEVEETRLETVVPVNGLPAAVHALVQAHPYEEPAFDIYPLTPRPVRGIGRCGRLPKPVSVASLARRLKRATGAGCVWTVGPPDRVVERAVIAVGAAGTLPFRGALGPADVIITGEIRHHDARTIQRIGCTALALGHWASERPVLASLAQRLQTMIPGITARVSRADGDPFATA